jgi:hypothetical protein
MQRGASVLHKVWEEALQYYIRYAKRLYDTIRKIWANNDHNKHAYAGQIE